MDTQAAARVLWDFHSVYDLLAPADVIIGLGSYDLRVASHCAKLFRDGWADRILFTGAAGNWTRDLFAASEAEAFKERTVAEGVAESAILLETQATNIGENIRFSAALLPDVERVIFVTKPQTQLRCKATVLRQWTEVDATVTARATPFDQQPLPHHGERALICEMVGDFDRMTTYAARGFQIEVPISDEARLAFDTLVAAGFVDHLPDPPGGR